MSHSLGGLLLAWSGEKPCRVGTAMMHRTAPQQKNPNANSALLRNSALPGEKKKRITDFKDTDYKDGQQT